MKKNLKLLKELLTTRSQAPKTNREKLTEVILNIMASIVNEREDVNQEEAEKEEAFELAEVPNIAVSQNVIDIIEEYIYHRYGSYVTVIDKKHYKLHCTISGIKNEIIHNDKWERIQLDVFLLANNKFLIIIDAFYASGLGNNEPKTLQGYTDMQKNYHGELSLYTKKIRHEIEEYIKEYR